MNIDKNNLPAEVFHFTINALRRGTGIRKLRPTDVGNMYGGGLGIKAVGVSAMIPVEDCYPTEELARSTAMEQLSQTRRELNLKHEMAITALALAEKALS